jgi:hypothetical protein
LGELVFAAIVLQTSVKAFSGDVPTDEIETRNGLTAEIEIQSDKAIVDSVQVVPELPTIASLHTTTTASAVPSDEVPPSTTFNS